MKKIRTGISTGCTTDLKISNIQSIELIKKLNYQLFELFIQSREEMTPKRIYELQKAIQNNKIKINSIHPFMEGYEVPNLFSLVPDKFQDGLNCFYRFIEICKILDAKYLIMHGPLPYINQEVAIERLNYLIKLASQYGVVIALENKDYTLFSSTSDIEYLYNTLQMDNWCFVLDFKSAWKLHKSPIDYAKVMKDKLLFSHVSFKNITNTKFGINFDYYDSGVIEIIEYLKEYFPDNAFILETSGAKDIAEFIKKQEDFQLVINKE